MKAGLGLAALLGTLTHPALAQTDASAERLAAMPVHSYHSFGGHLVCKTDVATTDLNICNRIGGIHVGDKVADIRQRLGEPEKSLAQASGATAMIFVIRRQPEAWAYWVVENLDGKVASVQLSGNAPGPPEEHFSTLQLGDPAAKLDELLGPRFTTRPVPQIQGVLRDYAPFPISVELVAGRVRSIKVSSSSP